MSSLVPGATVDRYRLVAPAGEGGQGSVWKAEDPLNVGAAVALKLVPLNAGPASSVERFRREARSLARLSHPSLPRCHALFEDLRHDVIGISLEFIEGSPLSVLMASQAFTTEQRTWVLRHLAAALAYIHESGLVHRDVKPQNVMIGKGFAAHPEDPAGVKLVDFGIAAESNNPRPLTVTGSVIGTNEFLSPEIIDRTYWKETADGPERDVFALGVLGYQLLRGKHPAAVGHDASLGDYMLAYREQEGKDTWPPGVAGDPLEGFFRGCLALRAGKRARDGAAVAALLGDRSPSRATRAPAVSALEAAPTEMVESKAAPSRLAARRSYRVIAGLVVGGAALFTISFDVSYSRPFPALPTPHLPPALLGPAAASPDAEEPPNATEPSAPSRPQDALPMSAHVMPAVTAAGPAPATSITCPKEMVAVGAAPPFCIDKREVTVAEYRRCTACGAAREAYWIGASATEAALKEQTANCTNTRTGLDNYPVNCVSFQDASAYCAAQQKRLPRMAEWRAARSSISLCSEMGGVCPMFEWSLDGSNLQGYRGTRGPSFRHASALEGMNVEVARNDDLGFRCAKDGAPR
jgi:eukaryotic-like serine/threonine-protein kinase